MPQCCVPCCLNRSESPKTLQLSFYRFPSDEKEKKKWLQALRRDNFTPSSNSRVCSWHFPNGKAAGPSRFAWNHGKPFQYHDYLRHTFKRKKLMVPAGGEDEGTDQLHNADIATAQPPSSKTLVVPEVENEQTFTFTQSSSHPDNVQYFTGCCHRPVFSTSF